MDIHFNAKQYDSSAVRLIGRFFDAQGIGLLAMDVKAITEQNEIHYLAKNRLYFEQSNTLFLDTILDCNGNSLCSLIIEIHQSGKLLYVNKLNLTEKVPEQIWLLANPNICYRYENENTISLFHTNGNLIYLRGVYYDLWEHLQSPRTITELVVELENKGFCCEQVHSATKALLQREILWESSNKDWFWTE